MPLTTLVVDLGAHATGAAVVAADDARAGGTGPDGSSGAGIDIGRGRSAALGPSRGSGTADNGVARGRATAEHGRDHGRAATAQGRDHGRANQAEDPGLITLVRDPHSGAARWPTRVAFGTGGTVTAGAAAPPVRSINPCTLLTGPRPARANGRPDHPDAHPVTALSAFFAALRTEAIRLLTHADRPGRPQPPVIDRVTVVVPAWYPSADRGRDLLVAAGEAAGFAEVELIDWATAIVLSLPSVGRPLAQADRSLARPDAPAPLDTPGPPEFPDGSLVLVWDLGQTWSTALLRVDREQVLPLAHESISAGQELDRRLLDDLRTQTGDWLEPRLAQPGEDGWWAQHEALEFVRQMKHTLSQREPGAEVSGQPAAGAPMYTLSRPWLDRLAEPGLRWLGASSRSLVARLAAGRAGPAPTGPADARSGLATVADVQAVVLAGGHARLAVAERILQEELGRPVIRLDDPELAALWGAARFAAGASSRRIPDDHPRWRVQPIAWDVPAGQARLERWLVDPGEPYRRGAVLAQVRTADERVYELTAPEDGVLLTRTGRVGEVVGPTLVATAKRPASLLAGDPPDLRHELAGCGEWLLAPDRRVLVECAYTAELVRLWSVPDGVMLREFRPEFDVLGHSSSTRTPRRWGRVFVHPAGRLALVAWDETGAFWVWDLHSGARTTFFRDVSQPTAVLVNEREWRLSAQGEDAGSAGRYRRAIATVWDLATGQRLEKFTDDWRRRLVGFAHRSVSDSFGDAALSPDGRLRAVPVVTEAGPTGVSLRVAGSDEEVFRWEHPPGTRVRVAFTADGHYLLANRESAQDSRVEVWEL
jgi:molecular chaperone DnaK